MNISYSRNVRFSSNPRDTDPSALNSKLIINKINHKKFDASLNDKSN